MGEIIKLENGQLRVPDYPTIPFIKGDGIGPEIWAAAQPVFDAAVKKVYGGTRRITWQPVLAGQAAFEQTGNWLPDTTLAALKRYLVAIKGPLTTPVGGGHVQLTSPYVRNLIYTLAFTRFAIIPAPPR